SFRERVIDYTRQTSPTGGAPREGPRKVRGEGGARLNAAPPPGRGYRRPAPGAAPRGGCAPAPPGAAPSAPLAPPRPTQTHPTRLGLALDEAVRLLKFPAPDDADRRRTVADELEALTAAADTLRRECRSLLERTTFAPVAARIGDLKFPAEASVILRSVS